MTVGKSVIGNVDDAVMQGEGSVESASVEGPEGMVVIFCGIVIEPVSPEQPWKAQFAILLRCEGNFSSP